MGIKKRLFPKRRSEGDERAFVITELKRQIRDLKLDNKSLMKSAEDSRRYAKISLKRGERERARNYLAQYKKFQSEMDTNNKTVTNFQYFIRIIRKGDKLTKRKEVAELAKKVLQRLASQAPPEVIATDIEEAKEYAFMIEEAAETTAMDMEVDYNIEVTDEELDMLETEAKLEGFGEMPEVPGEEEPLLLPEEDFEDVMAKPKEEVQDEIKKLREELDLEE